MSPEPSSHHKKIRALTLIVWIGAAALLLWVLRTVPLRESVAVLAKLRAWQIAILLIGNAGIILLFAARWWIILRAQGCRVPYLPLTLYRLSAFGINYFTPGQQFGGEPLQVYLIHRRHNVPLPAATASVALEKLIEMIINFAVVAAGVIITLQNPVFAATASDYLLAILIVLLLIPLLALAMLWLGRRPFTWLMARLPHRVTSTERGQHLRSGIGAAENDAADLIRRHPGAIVGAIIASLLSWVGMIGEVWLSMLFLGRALTMPQLAAVITASRIALLLPSPGGLGTLEAGQVWMFRMLGLDPAVGLSLALITRFRDVLFAVAGLMWGTALVSSIGGIKAADLTDLQKES